jgi:NADH-quinone oxidoreductase subunit J
MNAYDIVFLFVLVLCGLWTVMVPNLLKSAILLALTSVMLSIVMFSLGSPLAAIFELSVCASLITVVFVSAISLTKPKGREETKVAEVAGFRRFALLPLVLAVIGVVLWKINFQYDAPRVQSIPSADAREWLWNFRRFDLIGQIAILLTGAFGVVVLFKVRGKRETDK